MSDRFSDSDAAREALSALADGQAQSPEVARACAAWRDQADARAAWHAYQLIGDVMRSEDLAQTSRGDTFLKNFRERLTLEPVVLAPSAANANRPSLDNAPAHGAPPMSASQQAAPAYARPLKRRAWAGPAAVAAGFVMMVGALMSLQILPTGGGETGGAQMAQAGGMGSQLGDLSLTSAPSGLIANGFASEASRPRVVSVGSVGTFNRPGEVVIIRNPQLDQALAMQRAGELSFEGQGALTRPAVFDGR
jgi:sigma-E factor negative regulatory protein RseA